MFNCLKDSLKGEDIIAKKANDTVQAKTHFELNGKKYYYYDLKKLEEAGFGSIERLPFSIRILLESVLRQHDGHVIKDEHVKGLAKWGTENGKGTDVPFKPSRVILQRSEERRVGKERKAECG